MYARLRRIIAIGLICLMAISLASCGSTKKESKYVGSWYSIEDPDEEVLIITEDKVFSYDGEGGTISETENGFLLNIGWESIVAYYTEYEGAEALVVDDDMFFVKDYEKAKAAYDEKIAQEEAEHEAWKQEKAAEREALIGELIGDWTYKYFDRTGEAYDDYKISFKEDNTYRIDLHYGYYEGSTRLEDDYWQEGTWSIDPEDDYDIFIIFNKTAEAEIPYDRFELEYGGGVIDDGDENTRYLLEEYEGFRIYRYYLGQGKFYQAYWEKID